jgi:eukaryotic-like serine/threonine-protein kinase
MLGDLRGKLTTVGRLDLMRSVDDKATAYFASLDPRDLSDRALEEQARSLTGIGQVRLQEGNHPEAVAAFREAHARSTALYQREAGNGQRLFDLAQAEYWIGFVAWQQGRLDEAGVWLRQYRDSAVRLAAMDPGNFAWQREVAYGHHNLAVLDDSLGRHAEAERAMREELVLYHRWTSAHPDDTALRFEAANVASWLGSLMLRQGRLSEAEGLFVEAVEGFQRNRALEPDDIEWNIRKVDALNLLSEARSLQAKMVTARTDADEACAIALALTRRDPGNNDWRAALGNCRGLQAQLTSAAQARLAIARAHHATTLLARAHLIEPRNERVLLWLVRARHVRAQLALLDEDVADADRHVSSASALLDPAWQSEQNEKLRLWLASTRLLQGHVAHARGDAEAATTAWRTSLRMLRHGDEPVPFLRLDPLVRALAALGHDDEALPHLRRLDAAGYVPLQPWPEGVVARPR